MSVCLSVPHSLCSWNIALSVVVIQGAEQRAAAAMLGAAEAVFVIFFLVLTFKISYGFIAHKTFTGDAHFRFTYIKRAKY